MSIERSELAEKLARVIDPESWKLHDEVSKKKPNPDAQKALIRESKTLALRIMDSGLMTGEEWDRLEYIRARERIQESTSRRGYCYNVEDGLDGYFMHDPTCTYWPSGAIGGSNCVKGGRR